MVIINGVLKDLEKEDVRNWKVKASNREHWRQICPAMSLLMLYI